MRNNAGARRRCCCRKLVSGLSCSGERGLDDRAAATASRERKCLFIKPMDRQLPQSASNQLKCFWHLATQHNSHLLCFHCAKQADCRCSTLSFYFSSGHKRPSRPGLPANWPPKPSACSTLFFQSAQMLHAFFQGRPMAESRIQQLKMSAAPMRHWHQSVREAT